MVKKHHDWKSGAVLEEHSQRKHKILAEYFRRYLKERCKNPRSRRFRLAILDGFCGGGYYKNDHQGSPVIFVKTLLETVKEINIDRGAQNMPMVDVECMMILNDCDPNAISEVRKALAPFEAEAKEEDSHVQLLTEYYTGQFETRVDHFRDRIEAKRFNNVICFLDQYGSSKVRRRTITNLMYSRKSVEIFLTYAIESLIAFLNQHDPNLLKKQLQHLELDANALEFSQELLSQQQWLGTAERIVFSCFCQCAPYVTPFAVNNPKGWSYWFMHFANQYRARQVYNDVLHNNSCEQAHFGKSGLKMLSHDPDNSSLYLFDMDGRRKALEQLPDDIARVIAEGGDTIRMGTFYETIYNETPAHSDDINTAIMENPDLEVLTPDERERRVPNRISLDDTLRLRKQRSFSFLHSSNRK
ncbi:MAG: three-Cys-motif partner protein TcmP [Aestuariivita sp.]|nr:three-Cys-motif partner protein TcmP [Aestuariivita sp.]MCY4345356.1 three-Cys-motif partner protein TcmP [Aestuariivita sp.]